jgi:hypothetical protein
VGLINLEDLQVGMVLAADAAARNGRVLLRAGTTITEKHLHIFRAWGVTEADVEGVTRQDVVAEAQAQIDPQALERAQSLVRERFRHANAAHPFMAELRRLCLLRIVKAIGKAGA